MKNLLSTLDQSEDDKAATLLIRYPDYVAIKKRFNLESLPLQEISDCYFDTPLFELLENDCALRMRDTYKINTVNTRIYEFSIIMKKDDRFVEIKDNIERATYHDMITKNSIPKKGQVYYELCKITENVKQIGFLESLTTKRYEVNLIDSLYKDFNGKLYVDWNTYSDVSEYEIKYKGKSKASSVKTLSKLLEELGIVYEFSSKSKTRRFIESVKA